MSLDLVKYFEKANIFSELIIPKLEAVSNSGNGTTIHDANMHLFRIKEWKRNAEYYKDVFHIVTYYEYIRTAEIWLESIAKKGKE